MPVPSWVSDAIFYQIFPDRFANGDPGINPPKVRPWDSRPTRRGFYGGDLRGIIDKFDYLLDLGINAIYLNPIFESSSNHRYNAKSYLRIDPYLGDLKVFQEFIAVAKRNKVRVILDGVLNHVGREFFAFEDLVRNGEASAYRDWFYIYRFPIRAAGHGKTSDYAAWWGIRDLPKLNTDNPEVRKHLFDMTRYWNDQGIDGWRLDVPNEVGFSFWEEFSPLVKQANPEAYLVGEIWDLNPAWVAPERFDALMNYPLRKMLLAALEGTLPAVQMSADASKILQTYPYGNDLVMYNLLASHDTKRLLTALRGDVGKTKLAFAALFAFPGAPAIYYGDEIGMRGGAEPASRGAFPWDERRWNGELRTWIKKLITLHSGSTALRRGDYRPLAQENGTGLYSFARKHEEDQILASFNFSDQSIIGRFNVADLGWLPNHSLKDLLSGAIHKVEGKYLDLYLPAWNVVWLSPA